MLSLTATCLWEIIILLIFYLLPVEKSLVVVDVVREGRVTVTCQRPSSHIQFLIWEGIYANGNPILAPSTATSENGILRLFVPADVIYNQTIFTCLAYQTYDSVPEVVLTAFIIFQGRILFM